MDPQRLLEISRKLMDVQGSSELLVSGYIRNLPLGKNFVPKDVIGVIVDSYHKYFDEFGLFLRRNKETESVMGYVNSLQKGQCITFERVKQIEVPSYHILSSSDKCAGSDMLGIVLYEYDGKTEWELNGVKCKSGDIYLIYGCKFVNATLLPHLRLDDNKFAE